MGPVRAPCRQRRRRYPDAVKWRDVLDGIDAAESWIVAQSFWIQIVLLLVVLGPLCWFAAGLIDRIVDRVFRRFGSGRQAPGRADHAVNGS